MPIYEYRCLACGHQFELMQKFSDPPAQACNVCSGEVQKLISRSAFHLKGSGWYVTDYGRNGSKDSGKQDKSSADTASTTEGSGSTTSTGSTTSESSASSMSTSSTSSTETSSSSTSTKATTAAA
jgi:putative FmdB family regulatory protein